VVLLFLFAAIASAQTLQFQPRFGTDGANKFGFAIWMEEIPEAIEGENQDFKEKEKFEIQAKVANGYAIRREMQIPSMGRRYIPWNELLRRTFGEEVKCPNCGGSLRLIAMVKTEETIQTLLAAMHFPTGPPKAVNPGPRESDATELEWSGEGDGERPDWPEYPD
jgi:hypothetical protein